MGRAIRVDGSLTRDGLLKQEVTRLLEHLSVVTHRSLQLNDQELDEVRKQVHNLTGTLLSIRERVDI